MAIDMYIDGCKMADIEERTFVKHSNLPRLLERCLCKNEKNIQIGYAGLIPRKRLDSKFQDKHSGQLFRQLLISYPDLVPFLKGNYFGIAPYTTERVMNIRTLHEKFLRKCKDLEISDDEYPFNTESQGYYSLYRYIKKIASENIELASNRESKESKQKLMSTGIGKKYMQNPIAAL